MRALASSIVLPLLSHVARQSFACADDDELASTTFLVFYACALLIHSEWVDDCNDVRWFRIVVFAAGFTFVLSAVVFHTSGLDTTFVICWAVHAIPSAALWPIAFRLVHMGRHPVVRSRRMLVLWSLQANVGDAIGCIVAEVPFGVQSVSNLSGEMTKRWWWWADSCASAAAWTAAVTFVCVSCAALLLPSILEPPPPPPLALPTTTLTHVDEEDDSGSGGARGPTSELTQSLLLIRSSSSPHHSRQAAHLRHVALVVVCSACMKSVTYASSTWMPVLRLGYWPYAAGSVLGTVCAAVFPFSTPTGVGAAALFGLVVSGLCASELWMNVYFSLGFGAIAAFVSTCISVCMCADAADACGQYGRTSARCDGAATLLSAAAQPCARSHFASTQVVSSIVLCVALLCRGRCT